MTQFFRFCLVGVVGFTVDAGVLQFLVSGTGANPYLARVISFVAAASTTWAMNRHYTFNVERRATHREWARYVSLMVFGAVANYGAFAVSIAEWELARTYLWLAVAVGSVVGLALNFSTCALMFRDASA